LYARRVFQQESGYVMNTYQQLSDDYQRIEQAIRYLEANFQRQPELAEVAASVHLSEYHFQRLFTHWVGISPKRYLQHLTKESAKSWLKASASLLEAAYASGLSGPGRLHDLFVTCEAVTPGEFKHKGEGLQIAYGIHPSPFGECLLAVTGRGICSLMFVQDSDREATLAAFRHDWRAAILYEDPDRTRLLLEQIFSDPSGVSLPLHLLGTNFQIKVWEALMRIPPGALTTYTAVAQSIDRPTAARAVSNAVAHNPIAYIIPCHRVIRESGEMGGYRYGIPRKRAMLAWETARFVINP
jgi:AraC family transcriptional regulator of adaptative response/methylated-DNA-[protein]-cysteine methyltransferase